MIPCKNCTSDEFFSLSKKLHTHWKMSCKSSVDSLAGGGKKKDSEMRMYLNDSFLRAKRKDRQNMGRRAGLRTDV